MSKNMRVVSGLKGNGVHVLHQAAVGQGQSPDISCSLSCGGEAMFERSACKQQQAISFCYIF